MGGGVNARRVEGKRPERAQEEASATGPVTDLATPVSRDLPPTEGDSARTRAAGRVNAQADNSSVVRPETSATRTKAETQVPPGDGPSLLAKGELTNDPSSAAGVPPQPAGERASEVGLPNTTRSLRVHKRTAVATSETPGGRRSAHASHGPVVTAGSSTALTVAQSHPASREVNPSYRMRAKSTIAHGGTLSAAQTAQRPHPGHLAAESPAAASSSTAADSDARGTTTSTSNSQRQQFQQGVPIQQQAPSVGPAAPRYTAEDGPAAWVFWLDTTFMLEARSQRHARTTVEDFAATLAKNFNRQQRSPHMRMHSTIMERDSLKMSGMGEAAGKKLT